MSGSGQGELGPEDVRAVSSQFGLTAQSLQHLRTSQASVWRVEGPDGAYVVHVHRKGMPQRELEAMQRARALLARGGLPAVAPLANLDGETFMEARGHLVEVQPWIDHDRLIKYEWADVKRLASVLGAVHDVLGEDDVLADIVPARPTVAELATELREQSGSVTSLASAGGVHIDQHLAQASEVLDALADSDREPSTLEPTHGDLTSGNALIKSDRIVALIDFGMMMRRPRMADLGAALFWCLFVGDLSDPERQPWDRVGATQAAYGASTSRPVTEAEREGLIREIARIPAAGAADAHREPDPVAEILAFGRALPLAAWLLEDVTSRAERLVG